MKKSCNCTCHPTSLADSESEKFFLGEEKYLEHQKLHSDKYLCDYICNCPATSVAERVEQEITEAMVKAVEAVKIREGFTPFDDKQKNEVEIYNRGVSDSISAIKEAVAK